MRHVNGGQEMIRTGNSLTLLLILFLFAVTGCQSNPSTPDLDSRSENITTAPRSSHNLFGYYLIEVDTVSGGVNVMPLRSAEYHLNMTGVLNATMGVGVTMRPGESDFPNGLFVMDITLNHPFGAKPQLSGFDVKGIFVTPGSLVVGPLVLADIGETRLENADGYTRWWNPTEFTSPGMFGYTSGSLTPYPQSSLTATINPYKYFADALYPTSSLATVADTLLDDDQGRGVFTAGSSNTRRYSVRAKMNPGPQLVFGYAIDCSWDAPYPNPPDEVPDDFPIEANQPEPWRIKLQESVNTLYYDPGSLTGGGALKISASVYDWQGNITEDQAAEVSIVRFYAPELMSGSVDGAFLDQNIKRARYEGDLTGLLDISESGEVLVVCRAGSSDGSTYQQTGAPAPDAPLSAFHAMAVEIPQIECTADTNNDFGEAAVLDRELVTYGQLCAPTDYRDFYKMEIPPGNLAGGTVTLYCDVEPTIFFLYEGGYILEEIVVSGGVAVIDLDPIQLKPGTHYFRVLTQSDGQAFRYAIVPEISLRNVIPNAVDVTPDDLYFYPTTIDLGNNMLVTADNDGLWLYDVSDVNNMEQIWYMPFNLIGAPAFMDPYIYVAERFAPDDNRIHLIDITDPANPVVTPDVLTFTQPIQDILVEPGFLYVANYTDPNYSIDIFDISTDPASPAFKTGITHYYTPTKMMLIHDSDSADYWLVCMSTDERLVFWNVADKDSISTAFNWTYSGYWLSDIAVIDNYIFTLRIDTGYMNPRITALNIDADTANFAGDLLLGTQYRKIAINGDTGWISGDDGLLTTLDISTPGTPVFGTTVATFNANIIAMGFDGDTLYTACGLAGIRAYHAPSAPGFAYLGEALHLSQPGQFTIHKNHMYICENSGPYYAVKGLDLADPPNTDVTDEVLFGFPTNYITADGDRIIVSSSSPGLVLINCTDPDALALAGYQSLGTAVFALAIRGDALYFGTNLNNIETWDLTAWPVISDVDVEAVGGTVKGFAFKENIMYVNVSGGVEVFSILNPWEPIPLGTYMPLASAKNIHVDGDYLFIATDSSLEIADISTPQTPTFESSIAHPDAPHGDYLAVENLYAICQPYWTAAPTVFSIWPPDSPEVYGPLYGVEYAIKPNQTAMHNGYYYETDTDFAVRIWELY